MILRKELENWQRQQIKWQNEMFILSKEIARQLKFTFPNLIDHRVTDKEFLIIEVSDIRRLIEKYRDPLNRYVPNLWECEEISLAFMIDVRRGRLNSLEHLRVEDRKNLALGIAAGLKWKGKEKNHQANIFFSKKGIYLFDIQTQEIWKANPKHDDIFFVEV